MFPTLLIANRGEIAVRVIRACRALGIRCVAVYSDADRDALHVRLADEAIPIGPPEPSRSYLDAERIVAAARDAGARAIHPGYGFLSENADFAGRCAAAGLVFVGPSVETLRACGDKEAARRAMASAGLPVIPGGDGPTRTVEEARAVAERLGYPVLLKAAAGGGGRGIRVVADAAALAEAFPRASREAEQSFGDGSMYVERRIDPARHVEVQILADAGGLVASLGDRACSVQRRHQKILEEAPAPYLGEEARARLARAAEGCARAVGYRGAGTVEFLLDARGDFHFMEVNARIQVEHPVTELVTGIDLVQWQIRIADGEPLPPEVRNAPARGHAIEARLCAEDPDRGFSPCAGRVSPVVLPGGPGIRVDTALSPGDTIGLHYDSLVAKVCAHGRDREDARRRLLAALRETRIGGIPTTGPFLQRVLAHPAFRAGTYSTGLVPSMTASPPPPAEDAAPLAVAAAILEQRRRRGLAAVPAAGPPAKSRSRWRDSGQSGFPSRG